MPFYQVIDNADITYRKPRQVFESSVTLDDPAITANPYSSLKNAGDLMDTSNIHLLFVTGHRIPRMLTKSQQRQEQTQFLEELHDIGNYSAQKGAN